MEDTAAPAAPTLSEHVCLQQYILQNEESEDFPSSGCEEHWFSCAVPAAAAEGNNDWMCSDASSSSQAVAAMLLETAYTATEQCYVDLDCYALHMIHTARKSRKTRFLLDFIN